MRGWRGGNGQVRRFGDGRPPLVAYRSVRTTVLRIGPFRFHFYSDEGGEPAHIHVRTAEGECKFWPDPNIALATNRGVPAHELREIEKLVFQHQIVLEEASYVYGTDSLP